MVSNELARNNRKLLERVLATDAPREEDVIALFGGYGQYYVFMTFETETNQMQEIAHQLTPENYLGPGVRNYAFDTRIWQDRVLSKFRKDYFSS